MVTSEGCVRTDQ